MSVSLAEEKIGFGGEGGRDQEDTREHVFIRVVRYASSLDLKIIGENADPSGIQSSSNEGRI
jgi:hypothetical protein